MNSSKLISGTELDMYEFVFLKRSCHYKIIIAYSNYYNQTLTMKYFLCNPFLTVFIAGLYQLFIGASSIVTTRVSSLWSPFLLNPPGGSSKFK